MQENLLSYDKIIAHFTQETIEDRYKFLYSKMDDYIKEIGQENSLYINSSILQQTIMDYFVDIYRLKVFHKIEHINISKIVAYEVFWILRRKHIQNKDLGNIVFPNESFLTIFVAHELLVPEETEPLTPEQEEIFLKYLTHFNYYLKYRNVDKQAIESMLFSFETAKNMALCELKNPHNK